MRPDLDAIEARLKAATPGEWQVASAKEGGGIHAKWEHGQLHGAAPVVTLATTIEEGLPTHYVHATPEDGEFIAHAITDVEQLVAYARAQEKHIASLENPPAQFGGKTWI